MTSLRPPSNLVDRFLAWRSHNAAFLQRYDHCHQPPKKPGSNMVLIRGRMTFYIGIKKERFLECPTFLFSPYINLQFNNSYGTAVYAVKFACLQCTSVYQHFWGRVLRGRLELTIILKRICFTAYTVTGLGFPFCLHRGHYQIKKCDFKNMLPLMS